MDEDNVANDDNQYREPATWAEAKDAWSTGMRTWILTSPWALALCLGIILVIVLWTVNHF